MSLPSSLPIKRKRVGKRQGRGLLSCQRGAFSPFMFGLVVGVTIFSAVSMQYARQELVAYQKRQGERARAQAEDLASALDFAIGTETKETYGESYDLARAKRYAQTTGKTRGDQDFLLTTRQENEGSSYGRSGEKVAIAATDDALLRSKLNATGSAQDLASLSTRKSQPIAVYDTSLARDRQIRTSNSHMEQLAEQVFAFYAANMKFPTLDEYNGIIAQFPLNDAWGEDFDYDVDSTGQDAQLSFTTPWNYTQVLNLNLKDEQESAQ